MSQRWPINTGLTVFIYSLESAYDRITNSILRVYKTTDTKLKELPWNNLGKTYSNCLVFWKFNLRSFPFIVDYGKYTWNVLFCIHHHFSYFFWKHFSFPFEISFQTTNCIFLKKVFLNIKKNIDISGVLHIKYCTTNSINNSEFLKVIILLLIIIKGDKSVFLVTIISNIFNVFLITWFF